MLLRLRVLLATQFLLPLSGIVVQTAFASSVGEGSLDWSKFSFSVISGEASYSNPSSSTYARGESNGIFSYSASSQPVTATVTGFSGFASAPGYAFSAGSAAFASSSYGYTRADVEATLTLSRDAVVSISVPYSLSTSVTAGDGGGWGFSFAYMAAFNLALGENSNDVRFSSSVQLNSYQAQSASESGILTLYVRTTDPETFLLNTHLYTAGRTSDITAPVPEPETYAMLLAGLGMIGAVARRRKSDKALGAGS